MFSERERMLRNLLINEIDLLISPSEFLRDRFVAHGIPAKKFVISRIGIDPVPFDGFRKRAHQTLRFGFVGTIAPAKGVHVLIDAFNRIRDSSAELRIYGDFNPTKHEYHRFLLRKFKNPSIRFVGRYDRVVDPWSDIDVLVFPSIWFENYPQVLQEAFITRTPVVASRIGALPEIVRDGVNGFLFEAGNAEDLSAKMRLFLDNPDLVDTLAANPASVRSSADESIALASLYRMIMSK
jgi:glycosyltransferase involved in cell wall biosynthesis